MILKKDMGWNNENSPLDCSSYPRTKVRGITDSPIEANFRDCKFRPKGEGIKPHKISIEIYNKLYSLDTKPEVDKIFSKLKKKNPKQLSIIFTKIEQIVKNPYHFKPLRGDMHGARRVHIDKSFVLTYEIDEKNKAIIILDYDHHDNIY